MRIADFRLRSSQRRTLPDFQSEIRDLVKKSKKKKSKLMYVLGFNSDPGRRSAIPGAEALGEGLHIGPDRVSPVKAFFKQRTSRNTEVGWF